MSRDPAADVITLGQVELRAQASSSPILGGGLAAPIGSVTQVIGPSGGIKTWTKNTAPNLGWRDLLMRGPWFNVKEFGAVGDGVTNDRPAIQLALNAAIAAGGGTVFFPAGTFAVDKPGGNLGSFDLRNLSNLAFIGTGGGSTILMKGSAGGGDWYIFRLGSTGVGSNRIMFWNLRFDGRQMTGPDPAEQNHAISIQNAAATPVKDIDIADCWFEWFNGDGVRNAGNGGQLVQDVSIRRCCFTMRDTGTGQGCRANVTYNAAIEGHWITDCYCSGSDDNDIDSEVTQVSVTGRFIHLRNHVDHDALGAIAWTCGGNSTSTSYNLQSINGFNSISHGSQQTFQIQNVVYEGNNVDLTGYPAIGPQVLAQDQNCVGVVIAGNILVRESDMVTQGECIRQADSAGKFPDHNIIQGNLCMNLAGTNTIGINVESGTDIGVTDNLVLLGNQNLNAAVGISIRGTNRAGVNFVVRRNLCAVEVGNNMLNGIAFNTNAQSLGDIAVSENFVKNAFSGTKLNRTAAYTGGWIVSDNLFSTSNDSVEWAPTQIWGNIAGATGLHGVGIFSIVTGSPETVIAADVGCLCCRLNGGASTTLYVKESNAGLNTGWVAK